MKLLSIAIPCYNSEAYMENCIKSLLPGGDEVEILVIDDGSKDRTAEIADEYQEKYPGIVRAIHQPNLGHGGAVNTGIHNAQGLYFKVVDSDDWLDKENYPKVLDKLAELKAWREREGLEYEIEVDGSCNQATYEKLMAAGADVFIVGTSGLFNHAENIDEAWRIMTAQILAAKSEVQPHAKTA